MFCNYTSVFELVIRLFLIFLMIPEFIPQVKGVPKPVDRTSELLSNLRLTHINDLDDNVTCPKLHYIVGLRLRREEPQELNEDVPEKDKKANAVLDGRERAIGYNGFEITCSDGIHSTTVTRKLTFGKTGKWEQDKQMCKNGFAVGISTELTPFSSPTLSKILNMKIHCSDNSQGLTVKATDDAAKHIVLPDPQVSKETKQFCDFGAALITIAVKADSIITIHRGDLFSVTDLGITCASVINPVNKCDLKFRWDRRRNVKCTRLADIEKVAKFGGTKSISCSFDAWTGVGLDNTSKNAVRTFSRFETIGTGNDKEYVSWVLLKFLVTPESKLWFALHLPTKTQMLDDFILQPAWERKGSFSEDVEITPDLFAEPQQIVDKLGVKEELMYSPSVYQLVAFCSIYKVGFPAFQAGIDVYFHTKIRKQRTRISFGSLDTKAYNMKE